MGPHLPALVEHAPGPTTPRLWEMVREYVAGHVLHNLACKHRHYLLFLSVTLRLYKICVQVTHYHQLGAQGTMAHSLDDTPNG